MRNEIGTIFHEIRWKTSSYKSISWYIDKQINLDKYFWLFILGINNSGTTLIKYILESHPLIRSLPAEGQSLTRCLPNPKLLGVWRLWGKRLDLFHWTEKDNPIPALRARYDWLRYYGNQPGILLEKSPPNFVRSRWLQYNFKPVRFIAIVRNPYAVCEGIHRRCGCNIEDAAIHWASSMECFFNDIKYLDHCLLFRYEDFCQHPEMHIEKIENLLELEVPFDINILKNINVHNINEKAFDLQNFNEKSIKNLSQSDIKIINKIAGLQMKRFNYEQL